MSAINELIETLRRRCDLGIADQPASWLIIITKGKDLYCEVTVPHDALEWYASVTDRLEKKEVWSDWMDYAGYDDAPREELEGEMANDILAFVDRVSTKELLLPLKIREN